MLVSLPRVPALQKGYQAVIAPRKPNWDLKRDAAERLAKLDKRTQRAIGEIVRETASKGGWAPIAAPGAKGAGAAAGGAGPAGAAGVGEVAEGDMEARMEAAGFDAAALAAAVAAHHAGDDEEAKEADGAGAGGGGPDVRRRSRYDSDDE